MLQPEVDVARRRRGVFLAAALVLVAGAGAYLLYEAPPSGAAGGLPQQNECHTHARADYQGDMAVVWGSRFILRDAAACCAACQAHAAVCTQPGAQARAPARAARAHASSRGSRLFLTRTKQGKPFYEGAPHGCGDPLQPCNMWVYCVGGAPRAGGLRLAGWAPATPFVPGAAAAVAAERPRPPSV